MEGEEAGMRSKIRLRRYGECDGGGIVVGGKKCGTEYEDGGEEEEERLSGGRIALAPEDLREDDHRSNLGRSCTPLHIIALSNSMHVITDQPAYIGPYGATGVRVLLQLSRKPHVRVTVRKLMHSYVILKMHGVGR
jgi:hypothetical protein